MDSAEQRNTTVTYAPAKEGRSENVVVSIILRGYVKARAQPTEQVRAGTDALG